MGHVDVNLIESYEISYIIIAILHSISFTERVYASRFTGLTNFSIVFSFILYKINAVVVEIKIFFMKSQKYATRKLFRKHQKVCNTNSNE